MARCGVCQCYTKVCANCGAIPAEATPDLFDPARLKRIDERHKALKFGRMTVGDFIDAECNN